MFKTNKLLVVMDSNNTIHILNKITIERDLGKNGATYLEYCCGKSTLGDFEKTIKFIGTYEAIVDKLGIGPQSDYQWCRKCGFELGEFFK